MYVQCKSTIALEYACSQTMQLLLLFCGGGGWGRKLFHKLVVDMGDFTFYVECMYGQ
jgi:hypothetical protein